MMTEDIQEMISVKQTTDCTANTVANEITAAVDANFTTITNKLLNESYKQGTVGKAKSWLRNCKPDWMHIEDKRRQCVALFISTACDEALHQLNKRINSFSIEGGTKN